jgi:pimeloyl-ACP methyl ester carboxylesterase
VAPDQRGYGSTSCPDDDTAFTLLHLVGDIVGLVQALGESTAVVVGHDWGAPVAWNSAMLRPDIFKAVAALSVPALPRQPAAPTQLMRRNFGENFFYILHFQTPGVAEHELQRDVRRSMRMFLYSASGDAGERIPPQLPSRAGLLESMIDCDDLPPWLAPEDLDFFVAEYERTGFRGGLNWYRNMDRNWDLTAPFQGMKIEQPALFISGDRDLIRGNPMWESQMRSVVTNLRDPVILPGIGHWTQQEAPEAVNGALLSFLSEVRT